MKPYLDNRDLPLFEKYYNKCNILLEYGSGGSTYYAATECNNLKHIYVVEGDSGWIKKLKETIPIENQSKITFIDMKLDCKPNSFGYPSTNCSKDSQLNYSLQVKPEYNCDLIFIDGRFRVSCCLNCYDNISDECMILFDDFLDRPHYHIVLNFFEIIEKGNGRMVVLKKKENIDREALKNAIEKYQLVPN